MRKTADLKVKFLGIIPQYESKALSLSPQETAAFSGLLTFKGNSLPDLVEEAKAKQQDINKKVRVILNKSSLRGHASMATMPVFCFSFESSKMIGALLTGITFASALMHSGRRAIVTLKDNVYPTGIIKNKKALQIYSEASKSIINGFAKLAELGISHDEASKLLHYGTYGTGIITIPVESLVTFAREYEIEKEWMPEEAGIILHALENELKRMGVDILYKTRLVAPRNPYPYPNAFKDPKRTNLVRDLMSALEPEGRENKIVALDVCAGEGFKKRIRDLRKKVADLGKNLNKLKERWPELLQERRRLIRDYGTAITVRSISRVSWRIWRDKKRHRTAPVTTESIYYCIDRAVRSYEKFEKKIKSGGLNSKQLRELDLALAIPPAIAERKEARKIYLEAALAALSGYKKMIKLGVKPSDAVFVIPRALRIDMIQEYNLYNLVDGYFQLRSCPTADEQIYRQTRLEIKEIGQLLRKKGLAELAELIEPKCTAAGFCPEESSCGYIKKIVPGYGEDFHNEMKVDLEQRFLKI